MKITPNHLLSFIVLDLLLSPLFPFLIGLRISYFIIFFLGFLSLPDLFSKANARVSVFLSFIFIFSLISSFLVLISSSGFVISADSIYISASFLFLVLSSLVNIACDKSFFRYFPYIFFFVTFFNFLLVFLWNFLPDQILSIYFNASSLANSDMFAIGADFSDLRSWYRPLGVHGSPTYSALSVTVIYSFYVCLVRKGFVDYPKSIFLLYSSVVPLLTVLRYSSKTETVSVFILSVFLLLPWLRQLLSMFTKFSRIIIFYFCCSVLFLLSTLFVIFYQQIRSVLSKDYDLFLGFDITRFFNLLINPFYTVGADAELYQRIFAFFPEFLQSFRLSPFTGVGFLTSPDVFSTRYLHSDFLFVGALSGFLGLLIYLYILYLISDFSFVLAIPIILAGLTNSFLLPFPVSGCFFLLFVHIVRLSRLYPSSS